MTFGSKSLAVFTALLSLGYADLDLGSGYTTLKTNNFEAQIVNSAQVLASLKAAGSTFDFLPFNYLPDRARDGQYHWGDITYRYRSGTTGNWTSGDSSAARQTIIGVSTGGLASANLSPTLPSDSLLNVTREWIDVDGDLGLQFTITNEGKSSLEVGSLGFPAEFNSIFSGLTAEEIQANCSLTDPYIGMDAGYLRVSPVSGNGAALIVTPIGDTPFEASRNLVEGSYDPTYYASQTFEGYYEWQVFSKAYAEQEWQGIVPWNPASSFTLEAGKSRTFGLKFSLASDIRGIETAVRNTKLPFAVGVPGYILPRDLAGQLLLFSDSAVSNITVDPSAALVVTQAGSGKYTVTPSSSAFGRARVTIKYADSKVQTVHYYVTKSATEAVSDLGTFTTTSQWYTNTSDPFGRAPSVITYDHEEMALVLQDDRAWVAGLSDEAGAGSFLAAAMKQAAQPNADELKKLETFVSEVLFKTVQLEDFSVRKSAFYYQPDAVPGYQYDPSINFGGTWNKEASYLIDRGYDYVHVSAVYWALYRVGRAYPELLSQHDWQWYLNQCYQTVMRVFSKNNDVGYGEVGLMGETVWGELLKDLRREGNETDANNLEATMRTRAALWDSEAVPFGSEMAWDSTGQEGVYYWCKLFGYSNTAKKALGTVLGYMPSVAHWGWNGNARRYWDNLYGGKLRRIERQIHHYGSGLNALILLSEFRSNPSDYYAIRAGYGGMNGPLSSIHDDGFAAASFHSWPETLQWDGISGDYGPNFVGLVLGAGTYVAEDSDAGLVAYGGTLRQGDVVTVETRDALRRKVFIGPLGVLISVDAGIIQEFSYSPKTKEITVTLSQLQGVPKAAAAVLWVETTAGTDNYTVTSTGLDQFRLGWKVPLNSDTVDVKLGVS